MGAAFHKTIVQNEKLRNVLLERIGKLLYYIISFYQIITFPFLELLQRSLLNILALWHIARPEKDESVIEFFADQGVYTREMFDILLRRGIKEHNIETILEALSGQPSMSIISENEHDICKMHILKWPELDIFDLFLKSGLDSLRVNRIRNRLGFYANIMLKETLVENFGEREFQYAEKAFEVSKLS